MKKIRKKYDLEVTIKKKKDIKYYEYIDNNDKKVIDERFTPVEITVLHTGLNRNNSYFSKEVVEKAISSLENIPILGKIYIKDKKDFGDHEQEIMYIDNEIKITYNTIPYGVVPKDNNVRFIEQYDASDNQVKEYLVVDGLIWNRMESAIEILNRDEIKKQSMEIVCYSHIDEEQNIEIIDDFEFIGLTFLGDDVEPGMSQANIKKKKYQYSEYYNDIEKIFNKLFNFKINEIIKGEYILNKKFSELTNNQVENQIDNQVENQIDNQETDNNIESDKKKDDEEEKDIKENETLQNQNNNEQNENKEIKNNIDDNIDNNSNIEHQNSNTSSIKEIENSFINLLNKANMELQSTQEKYNKLQKEFEDYKQRVENNEKERIIEKFSIYLKDNKEFSELCNKKNEFNIIEFENKCNKIYTEFSLSVSEKDDNENKNKSIFFSFNNNNNNNENKGKYDDFINKFLNKDI